MRNPTLVFIVTFICTTIAAQSQQVADPDFNPIIENPAYEKEKGPTVFIDESHHNFHTMSGRFKPFAFVLEKDGYIVQPSAQPFTNELLANTKIMVIANAVHESNT